MRACFKPWAVRLAGLMAASLANGGEVESPTDQLFTGPVHRLQIEIPAEGMKILRDYKQVWR